MERDLEYNGDAFVSRLEALFREHENNKPEKDRKSITQQNLAELIGVDSTQISKWRSKKAKRYPTVETMYQIASAFNCSIDVLLGSSWEYKPNMSLKGFLMNIFSFYIDNYKIRHGGSSALHDIELKISHDKKEDETGVILSSGSLTFTDAAYIDELFPMHDFASAFNDCEKIIEMFGLEPKEYILDLIDKVLDTKLDQRYNKMNDERIFESIPYSQKFSV